MWMSAARKKAWVEDLLTKRDAIERAVGMPLGRMLGCGHWGCVFEGEPPWVVKLSIDPTEGPIWMKILNLVGEERYGDGGFPEIRLIRRIMPDLVTGGRKRKVWAIVREGIEPVFVNDRKGLRFSQYTLDKLGLPVDAPAYGPRAQYGDFSRAIEGLDRYRLAAQAWHRRKRGEDTSAWGFPSLEWTEEYITRLDRHFSGAAFAPLGESLSMLASNGVYLRDVHLLNIGWHIARDDDDWDRVVIFDPGHTPTAGGGDIETVLVEEGREAL